VNAKIAMVPRVALVDLAKAVDRLLRMQADYFATKKPSKLAECRDAERRMRDRVAELLQNPDSQATLFAEASAIADEGLCVVASNRLEFIAGELQKGKGDRASTVRELFELAAMLGRKGGRK
jgi:hypothetical protein